MHGNDIFPPTPTPHSHQVDHAYDQYVYSPSKPMGDPGDEKLNTSIGLVHPDITLML